MADIVVITPVLQRPANAQPLVDSVLESSGGRARVLFVATPGDHAEHAACIATGADLLVLPCHVRPGDWARKINHAYRNTDEPLLFLGADDLRFRPGWLEAAERRIAEGAHVVGVNDLGNPQVMAGEHATHFVVTRRYVDEYGTIDEPGKVLCERYPHEWVDNEFVETARYRGVWAMALDAHVEHLHPNWIGADGRPKAEMDPLYRAQRARMAAGKPIFLRRRPLWSGG